MSRLIVFELSRVPLRKMIVCLSLVCFVASSALAENWPNWRGPNNNGISGEKDLPTEWGPGKNVAWKIALPGPAGATPVVWEDRIFLTAVAGDDLLLLAYSTKDGKELWRQTVGKGNQDARKDEGNSASPSPVTDGKHVWAFMGSGDLGCYTLDGKKVYNFNLQDRYGKFDIQFGMTSTPVLYKNMLIFQLIHGKWNDQPQPAWVVALDKTTGEQIWKHLRKSDAFAENVHSYASPVIYEDDTRAFLLTHGADYVIAHDLATGDEIWRAGGLNPKDKYNQYLRLVASPSFADGIIVVPSAKNGPVLAIKPDGKGNITGNESQFHWIRDRDTPDVPSPVIVGGIVYLCKENGIMIAMDRDTGEELYMERVHGTRHRASPVYADGHIYITGRDGVVSVLKTGPELKVVSQNTFDEQQASSPVISNGTIYLRTFDSLIAIRNQ